MDYASKKLKVHKSQVVAAPEGFSLLCGDGKHLKLLTVQAEGKKAMPAEEFLRGIH
jgi:methionyl-tRNA formyltransferase